MLSDSEKKCWVESFYSSLSFKKLKSNISIFQYLKYSNKIKVELTIVPSFWIRMITNSMFVWYIVYSTMLMKQWQMYLSVKHMPRFMSGAKLQKCCVIIPLSGSNWLPCQCGSTSFLFLISCFILHNIL